MQFACSRATHHKRYIQPTGLHQFCHMAHLLKRRGYKSAQSHDIGIFGNSPFHNLLTRNHHAQVYNLIAIASHYHRNDILSYIMHIAFHSSNNHLTGICTATRRILLGFDKRIKPLHGLLHGACALYHLRKEQFSFPEKPPHFIHARHQWSVNYSKSRPQFLVNCSKHFFQPFVPAAHYHTLQTGLSTCRRFFLSYCAPVGCRCSFFHFLSYGNKAVGSLCISIKYHIFDSCTQPLVYLVVRNHCSCIHDCHIHTLGNSMVQEYRMHRFTHSIVSSERERQVTHASTHLCPRQIGLYPFHCTNKVKRIAVMAFYTSSNSQHIRVKNYIVWIKIHFLGQNSVSSRAHLHTAFVGISLPCFIKCHHHHGSTHLLYVLCFFLKHRLAVLQTYRVHNALALHTLESGLNNLPPRRVNHHRHSRDIGLGCNEPKKMRHLGFGI